MNTKKKKMDNGNKNHDVAGIVCIVISSFFLICLITPLLSDIGAFVKSLTTGLLGYASYPILLCTLFYGILLLLNKKAIVSGKQAAYIILMAVCAMFILQTALDSGRMQGAFGEYLGSLISFNKENTTAGKSVGGVILGIFAYGIKSILSFVGAYILYSLLLVLFGVLLVLDLRSGINRKSKVKEKRREPMPFVKGQASPEPVRDVTDTSLFVYKIEPNHRVNSQSGDFESIYTPIMDTMQRYDSVQSEQERELYSQYGNSQYGNEQRFEQPETKEDKAAYENAKKVLFGETDEMFKSYNERIRSNMNIGESVSGRSNSLIDDTPSRPQTYTAKPQFESYNTGDNTQFESYNKSGSTQKYNTPQFEKYNTGNTAFENYNSNQTEKPKSVLPEVPMPPEKDVSDQFVDGPIINGEDVSRAIQDNIRLRRKLGDDVGTFAPKTPEQPPIITGNPRNNVVEREPEEERTTSEQPPIITGNPARNKVAEMEEPEEERTTPDLPPIITGNPARNKVTEREEPEEQTIASEQPSTDEEYPKFDSFEEEELPEEAEEEETEQEPIAELQTDEQEPTDEDEFANEQPPIITGSDEQEEPAEEEIEIELPPIITGDNKPIEEEAAGSAETGEDETPAETTETQAAKSYFEKTVLEEPEASDYELFDDEEPSLAEQTEEEEDSQPVAKIPDSLKLIEEEVDKSETREEIEDDNTGYYVTEGFDKNVKDISLKLNDNGGIKNGGKDNNQIHMEDYSVVSPPQKPKKKKHLKYSPPPIELLINNSTKPEENDDYEEKARALEEVLHNLRVEAKVIGITRGPAVTRYELEMPLGQSVKRIPNCADDIAYSLASNGKVRIEAPIKGKRAVGVEVPNQNIAIVSLREIIDSKEFSEAKSCLTLALGKDITGNIITCNLEKMPHLLIAGTTGSGKSACLNSIIISILYKASPEDVRLILIDPKQVEFVLYRDMPHLLIKNIINDSTQAINAFKWAREEMDRRYTVFAKYAVRNLSDYNECAAVKSGMEPKLPRVVIIVDELAELMLAKNAKELEQNIMSMAQKARAAGMHLILATQRPSVDVLTGTIKANLPSRIAFAVKSIPDSRTILDQIGAEALLGRGDMLYAPIDQNDPKRVQGAFITTEEVENIVNFVRTNNENDYDESVENIIMRKPEEEASASGDEEKNAESADPLMKEVLRKVIETNQASASQIQRRFSVGYNRASRIIDQMEENGYIGPLDGAKPREVYITREKFRELYGEDA